MTDEIARLVELSGRATQGEWCGRLLFEITVEDSELCDALVNWFRAHQEELKEGLK